MFDYTAGGMVKTADLERKTFLVNPKTNIDSAFFSARISSNKKQTSPGVARSEVLARWRDDKGPIGRAVQNGEYELLREAIREVKKRSIR